MERLGRIALCLGIGAVITLLSSWLGSTYLESFLSQNLITLLVALVAINTTTLSVVLTKIREILDKLGGNFTRTATEMKISIVEQIMLVVAAALVQLLGSSRVIVASVPATPIISNVVLLAIFAYAIHIVYDTANSVFVLMRFETTAPKPAAARTERPGRDARAHTK